MYPNPFNPSTTIEYSVSRAGRVVITVFDMQGRSVTTLVDQNLPVGHYSAHWDGLDCGGQSVAAGVYFCRFDAGEFSESKRMTLVK